MSEQKAIQQLVKKCSNLEDEIGMLVMQLSDSDDFEQGELLMHEIALKKKDLRDTEKEMEQLDSEDLIKQAQAVVQVVSELTDIPVDAIHSKCRFRNVADVRAIAIALIYRFVPHVSLKKIGLFMGSDHTVILYNIRKVSKLVDIDTEFTELHNRCEKAVAAAISRPSHPSPVTQLSKL